MAAFEKIKNIQKNIKYRDKIKVFILFTNCINIEKKIVF